MPRRRDGAYYLFHDYDLRAVCDNQQEQTKKAIENADGNAIRSGDADALTEAYVAQFGLEVPQLAEGATSVEVEEAQVDVSRHHPPRERVDRHNASSPRQFSQAPARRDRPNDLLVRALLMHRRTTHPSRRDAAKEDRPKPNNTRRDDSKKS